MTRITLLLVMTLLATTARSENWPRFRGPTGQGVSSETALPTTWSVTDNVAWKAEIGGEGWSSPIVWDDKVFVTAALNKGVSCHVLCLDAATGKVLWDVEVFQQVPTKKQGQNSYATATPVTDGQYVYAFFSSGGAAALSFDGKVAWTYTADEFYSQHGLGASPILYKDLLLLPWDHSIKGGPEPKIGWQIPWDKSYVLALDKATGKPRYKAQRGMTRIAHVTPNVVDVNGKPQLISPAGDAIEAFDPDSGQRLWWAEQGGEGTTPSPVFGNGIVYACSGFPTPNPGKTYHMALRAYRLGGAGDVTRANLVWEHTEKVPTLASPLLADKLLYLIAEDGTFQCLEPADGKLVYREKLKGKFSSSPVYADGKVYLLSTDGNTTVIAAGRKYKQLAQNDLGEPCKASMAVSNHRLFIRTDKHLFCVRDVSSTK